MENNLDKILKEFITEVAMSPSLRTAKVLDDPLQSKNVAENFHKMIEAFSNALMLNLTVANFQSNYNPETRDFDDAKYEQFKKLVEQATKIVSDAVQEGLRDTWNKMHQASKQEQVA